MPLIFFFSLIERNAFPRTRISKYSEIGFPCLKPFSSLKYCVVVPPLIMQDSRFLDSICIHLIKVSPKPKF